MPLKFKVSFDYPTLSPTGKGRVERRTTDEMTATLRGLGYTDIRVVPVRESARARAHGRRIESAEVRERRRQLEAAGDPDHVLSEDI